jgi:hypothetical protein
VRAEIARGASPRESFDAIRPAFAELLADGAWLPDTFQHSAAERHGRRHLARSWDYRRERIVIPDGDTT